MKLGVVTAIHNRPEVTAVFLDQLRAHSMSDPEVVVIDNGSDWALPPAWASGLNAEVVRNSRNLGVWPTFAQGLRSTRAELVAFLHNDLRVHETGWDRRVVDAFSADDHLGLLGFVGSSEQDWLGGRGAGTMSNFQGKEGGSPAECHGARITDLRAAFVVDGCAMVFRREALSQALEVAGDFPPHHFYDRLLSLVMYELGWRTAVLGIACDHLSGQTANTQGGWVDTAMDWCRQQGLPADGDWDHAVYLAAERSFLRRLHAIMGAYRLIRVSADFTIRLL